MEEVDCQVLKDRARRRGTVLEFPLKALWLGIDLDESVFSEGAVVIFVE